MPSVVMYGALYSIILCVYSYYIHSFYIYSYYIYSYYIHIGTDSAPHAVERKEATCGCAGIYTYTHIHTFDALFVY